MKVDPSKPLAENVYHTLTTLLAKRSRPKDWEVSLLTQAALELEASDPTNLAEFARLTVVYCLDEDTLSGEHHFKAGQRLRRRNGGWWFRDPDDPQWRTRHTYLPGDTRIHVSPVQEL